MTAEIRTWGTSTCDSPEAQHPGFGCAHPITDDLLADLDAAGMPHPTGCTCPRHRMTAAREARVQEELAKLPHGIIETARHLVSQARRYDFRAYECSACGQGAELGGELGGDGAAVTNLLEHCAYEHVSPADLLAGRLAVYLPANTLTYWLGRSR